VGYGGVCDECLAGFKVIVISFLWISVRQCPWPIVNHILIRMNALFVKMDIICLLGDALWLMLLLNVARIKIRILVNYAMQGMLLRQVNFILFMINGQFRIFKSIKKEINFDFKFF